MGNVKDIFNKHGYNTSKATLLALERTPAKVPPPPHEENRE